MPPLARRSHYRCREQMLTTLKPTQPTLIAENTHEDRKPDQGPRHRDDDGSERRHRPDGPGRPHERAEQRGPAELQHRIAQPGCDQQRRRSVQLLASGHRGSSGLTVPRWRLPAPPPVINEPFTLTHNGEFK